MSIKHDTSVSYSVEDVSRAVAHARSPGGSDIIYIYIICYMIKETYILNCTPKTNSDSDVMIRDTRVERTRNT